MSACVLKGESPRWREQLSLKSPTYVQKAVYTCKRALHKFTRAPCICKIGLYVLISDPQICKRALHTCIRALYPCKRALHKFTRAPCTCRRGLYILISNPNICKRALHTCVKEPCKLTKEPHTNSCLYLQNMPTSFHKSPLFDIHTTSFHKSPLFDLPL